MKLTKRTNEKQPKPTHKKALNSRAFFINKMKFVNNILLYGIVKFLTHLPLYVACGIAIGLLYGTSILLWVSIFNGK